MKYNHIELPNNIAGFECLEVCDYEKTNAGLGFGIEYNIAGCKATIYIYDKQNIIPNDLDDELVVNEFNQALSDIFSFNEKVELETVIEPQKLDTKGIGFLFAGYRYADMDGEIVNSLIFLTALLGSFVKVRLTFSAINQPELGNTIQSNFMTDLTDILSGQL